MDEIDRWVSLHFPDAVLQNEGGQRRVYQIGQTSKYALKIWQFRDSVQHERHVREVSALARLKHPSLPKIVAHLSQVEIGGRVYAMYQEEWIDAPALSRQVQNFPLNKTTFHNFACRALEALDVLHSVPIVHRDISLNNILWDGERAFIIDLGLAKHLDMESLTRTSDRVGMTYLTASPEQLQGIAADLRTSTDVYSLGVILFMVCTGRHPYVDSGEVVPLPDLIARQVNKDLRADSPEASFIMSMLEPVQLFRPTVRQLLDEVSCS